MRNSSEKDLLAHSVARNCATTAQTLLKHFNASKEQVVNVAELLASAPLDTVRKLNAALLSIELANQSQAESAGLGDVDNKPNFQEDLENQTGQGNTTRSISPDSSVNPPMVSDDTNLTASDNEEEDVTDGELDSILNDMDGNKELDSGNVVTPDGDPVPLPENHTSYGNEGVGLVEEFMGSDDPDDAYLKSLEEDFIGQGGMDDETEDYLSLKSSKKPAQVLPRNKAPKRGKSNVFQSMGQSDISHLFDD